MEKMFIEVIELAKTNILLDPWVKKNGVKGYCRGIKEEAEEIMEALENKDYQNLKEELGDVMWDCIHACLLAEEEELFTLNDVFSEVLKKYNQRKPYLKTGKMVSPEEARRLWHEAKKRQKEQ